MAEDDPLTFNVRQAAEILGIGYYTAHRLIREGRFPLPVHRVGRSVRISGPQLRAYLGIESVATPPPREPITVADELTKLADLRDRGLLTEQEFAAQKARLLAN